MYWNQQWVWSAVKGYDTKRTRKGSVFVTNKYNLKGLEFPFIICVANKDKIQIYQVEIHYICPWHVRLYHLTYF